MCRMMDVTSRNNNKHRGRTERKKNKGGKKEEEEGLVRKESDRHRHDTTRSDTRGIPPEVDDVEPVENGRGIPDEDRDRRVATVSDSNDEF
jgi:hypothetical protein